MWGVRAWGVEWPKITNGVVCNLERGTALTKFLAFCLKKIKYVF